MAYYEYEDTKLYYEEVGTGTPFLLIHGWAIDHRFLMKALEPVFEGIERDYGSNTESGTGANTESGTGANTESGKPIRSFRRIYIDVPGMGLSEPGKVKNGDDIVNVLEHFMDDIAPGEKLYIGGNSFGAHITRGFTARNYDKVLGMLLLVPAVSRFGHKPEPGTYFQVDKQFMATLSEEEREGFALMNANLIPEVYERYVSDVLPSVMINENNDFLHKVLRGTFSFDLDKVFEKKKFRKPVLILTGKYDTAVGYTMQLKWLEVLPNSSYICVDGAGHNVSCDQPVLFEHAVRGWIEQFLM